MKPATCSTALCAQLHDRLRSWALALPHQRTRYEAGDTLSVTLTTAWPEAEARARLRVLTFAGGGFAGQVYRCVLDELDAPGVLPEADLKTGGIYAVKILIPPSSFSRRFRNLVYWLGFQSAFNAQVHGCACRAGILWRKLIRREFGRVVGDTGAVADVYASFYDLELGAYGEIGEWVEGRTWRLEPDTQRSLRKRWRNVDPHETGSPEYVAKRQFMARLVALLHDMGAPELARQYEWWTLKSQPNVLKRLDAGDDPAKGLCAVDFRAGLALLPFLPMSPADLLLIARGVLHGSWVQFDRPDIGRLRAYLKAHAGETGELGGLVDRLEAYERAYRRSMPDITHQGLRLLWDRSLRSDVRAGLVQGYEARGLCDAEGANRLRASLSVFTLFYLAGALPLAGRFLRRCWGNAAYRAHVRRQLNSWSYARLAGRASAVASLIEWHRDGRCGEHRTNVLAERQAWFWCQRFTLAFLPPVLHRYVAEPRYAMQRLRAGFTFLRSFYGDPDVRERWLADLIHRGHEEGMVDTEERDRILDRIRDPFIAKYLKCVGVHFATLPVTQVVSLVCASAAAVWVMLRPDPELATWDHALLAFGGVLLLFQVTPISPGSLCRGAYVVYLIVRERNFADYMVAAPLSFVKYIGYLAFPIQMVTKYPALARYMAGTWARDAVHHVPVFGEKGALLEHAVFDMFFNVPRVFGRWARRRVRLLLNLWMLAGVSVLFLVFVRWQVPCSSQAGANTLLGVTAVTILPRVLFYPVLKRQKRKRAASAR